MFFSNNHYYQLPLRSIPNELAAETKYNSSPLETETIIHDMTLLTSLLYTKTKR